LLPVVDVLEQLRSELGRTRRGILVAPPGAGKTTLVPPALLEATWLGDQRIVMLEPRRLATRAAARRMAEITGTNVGDLIGYQTRDERRIGPATRIEVVTEGILTRRLQNDPELPGVAVVIFDEVHERNLPTDLGLALALDAGEQLRPDLAILAMSATPDIDALGTVLATGNREVSIISTEGRQFPVELIWMPRQQRTRLEPAVVAAVTRALREQAGDLLVFLPGIGEIMRTRHQLRTALNDTGLADQIDIWPLAGTLSPTEQDQALAPSPPGRRRIVLTTDIAETSLTVDGVRVVVDSGLARAPRFDTHTEMTRLTTITTSRSSAEQRAGRAGRTEPGACYRLWSKIEHGSRPAHRTPEIREVDLAGLALELAAWGTPADQLAFIDEPPRKTLVAGRDLLIELDALDEHGQLTEIGSQMLGLPLHPRLARMLIARPEPLSCLLAVLLDERDLLRPMPGVEVTADLALRIRVLAGIEHHERADRATIARLRDRARELARRAQIDFDNDDLDRVDADQAGSALLFAFGDRLAARRRPGQFQLLSGTGAWLPDDDPLSAEPYLVAADLDGRRDRSRIRLAAAVEADDVLERFADRLSTSITINWDTERDDLIETVDRRLGAINLGSATRRPAPGEATTDALLGHLRATRLAALFWTPSATSVRQRVEFLHRHLGDPWPDWSIETLTATIDQWLLPWIDQVTTRAELDAIDLNLVLRSQLPWEVGAELDHLAPAMLELPDGRSSALDYSGEAPAASVRVQRLFGLTTHPVIANQPVVLTLLSPADRPIQITADLPGFWSGSWAEVRRDMAGRYPKHDWPEDPASK